MLGIKFKVASYFFFQHFDTFCLMASTISIEKSAVSHITAPLENNTFFFPLPVFQIFFLSLLFRHFTMIQLSMIFFASILLRLHSASWICDLLSFISFGEFYSNLSLLFWDSTTHFKSLHSVPFISFALVCSLCPCFSWSFCLVIFYWSIQQFTNPLFSTI